VKKCRERGIRDLICGVVIVVILLFRQHPMRKEHAIINSWQYKAGYDIDNSSFNFEIDPPFQISIPKGLYMHCSLEDYHIDTLYNRELFARHPYHFNDPFDCSDLIIDYSNVSLEFFRQFLIPLNYPKDRIDQLYHSNKILLIQETRSYYWHGLYQNVGLISLSSERHNLLMWGYYTGHLGFSIKLNFKNKPSNFFGPFPVYYQNEIIPIDFSKGSYVSLLYQSNIKNALWNHENEWRILVVSNNMTVPGHEYMQKKPKNRLFKMDEIQIEEIILGYSFFTFLGAQTKEIDKNEFIVKFSKNCHTKKVIRILNW